mgnify:CR=1 FL=1
MPREQRHVRLIIVLYCSEYRLLLNRHKMNLNSSQQKARDDIVWQALYLRDFHELHEDESGMEIEGTNKWQQRYRFAADLPKWDRENTTDVFILSDNDRLAQRNGSGAFPKAITAKPIGLSSRPIKITCMRSAEFGLFTADSPGRK